MSECCNWDIGYWFFECPVHDMVCGCTWSAHTIHIKLSVASPQYATTTYGARSTNQPTMANQPDQPVETCLLSSNPTCPRKRSCSPPVVPCPAQLKTKGWLWSRAGWCQETPAWVVRRPGREICIPTRKTIRMDHADVIVASPYHWCTCLWRWVDPKQRSSVGAISTIVLVGHG